MMIDRVRFLSWIKKKKKKTKAQQLYKYNREGDDERV